MDRMTKVLISRYWNNPKINTKITNEGIFLEIELDDFVLALKKEIGSVTTTFTQKSFDKKVDEAVETVLKKIKESTCSVASEIPKNS
jgi:hypothetical protein